MEEQRYFQFNILAFIVAFVIGMIYVYINVPPIKVIVTYPTPYNAGTVVYKDSADTCFVFDAEQVDCPEDTTKIKKQPIIE